MDDLLQVVRQHRENLVAIARLPAGADRQLMVMPYWDKIKSLIYGVAEKHPRSGKT